MIKYRYTTGPIFIVGMNGSGTTMMAECLSNHPNIFIPRFESKIIPYYYFHLSKFGDLNLQHNFQNLLVKFSNARIFRNLNKNSASVNVEYDFDQIENKNLSTIIDLTFSYFAQKQGKNIWGDHSPKYSIFLNILVELFPNCKIIHIVRDGRDCALSLKRRFNMNISRAAFQWKKIVQAACTDGSRLGPKRYYEIHYEDLTYDPERYMRILFNFLELSFDAAVLKSKMPMYEENGIETKTANTIVPNSEKWRSGLSESQIRKIEAIAGKTLKQFDYEIKFIEGDFDLSPFRIFLLQILGRLNKVYYIFKNTKIKHMFKRLYRAGSASLKQMRYFKY